MKLKRVYQCDGTVDGIFTAIYEAWESRYGHADIMIAETTPDMELELFTEYINIRTDEKKASKVADSIQRKISMYAYELVIKSALSNQAKRSDAIYRFLQLGFAAGSSVSCQLSHPYVTPIFEMERRVNNEMHHYMEFVRFSELENAILLSRIRPENNIITLIAPHFEDRLPEENWMIYDERRSIAAIHRKRYPWILVDGNELNIEEMKHFSGAELDMQLFWKTFVDTIAIKDRSNKKLQSQLLPNRYREFMREVPYKEK
ncbi:MAG: TIGR03915 family putative DNA repair protein [Velocimicrobium sp.]